MRRGSGKRAAACGTLALALIPGAAGSAAADAPSVPVLDEIRIPLPEPLHSSRAPSPASPVVAPAAPAGAPAAVAGGSSAEAAGKAELARCRVLVWITADGTIRAAQVIDSSGAPRLDVACAHGLIGRRVEPSVAQGHAIDSWAIVPLVWVGSGSPAARHGASRPIPALAPGQALHLQPPYYPIGALQRHEQGDCTVQAEVSADGHLKRLELTRSSGSQDLDAGCLAAIYAARFTPARSGTQPVDAITDVVLHWQLIP